MNSCALVPAALRHTVGIERPAALATESPAPALEQTYLDLGQRSFGRTIECKVCGLIYAEGEPSDEAAHRKHHKQALQAVCVRSVLAELHVVGEREDGDRIVALRDTDGAEDSEPDEEELQRRDREDDPTGSQLRWNKAMNAAERTEA